MNATALPRGGWGRLMTERPYRMIDDPYPLAEIMGRRLQAAGITTPQAAYLLSIDERDRVLGVAGWTTLEDAAWLIAVCSLS